MALSESYPTLLLHESTIFVENVSHRMCVKTIAQKVLLTWLSRWRLVTVFTNLNLP